MTTNKPKHDQLFCKAMENPIVAKEFFEAHLPKDIRNMVDTNSLKLEKTSFIEQNLRRSASDVLFSAKFDNRDGYLYLIVEHQSSADHFMAFRLLRYMISICSRYLIANKKAKHLPFIYPMIFFNGQQPYNISRNLWGLFENSQLTKDIWTNDYQLINVHDIANEELKKRAWSGIMEFFLKYGHERELLNRWQEIADILPQFAQMTMGHEYLEIILFYTLTKIKQTDKIELEKLLISQLNQETGEKLMVSLARHWEEEGIQKGKAEGIRIGEARGEARGEAKLIKTMINNGNSIEEVARMTKLSIAKINELLKI